MTQKKLPRDFAGILFYVIGLVIGLIVRVAIAVFGFIGTFFYKAFKRDQFNRRLRFAENKAESEDATVRALGREEIRYLAANLGLTNSKWHQTVKVRRRMLHALNSAAKTAFESNDLTERAAGDYTVEVNKLLFANFDRNLLTAEPKKRNRRFRISSRTMDSETAAETVASENSQTESENREIYTTSRLVPPQSAGTNETDNRNLNVGQFQPVAETAWTADDEVEN